MLEDDFTYVLRKALKGHGLAPAEAARLANLPENDVLAFSRGHFSDATARRLAPVLGLDPDSFASHPNFLPRPLACAAIHRLDLPFGQEQVNAWLIWQNETAILFDTGHRAGACLAQLQKLAAPPPCCLFVTHAHADHTGGLGDFKTSAYGPDIPGTEEMKPGREIRCGSLTIRACDLSGHAVPALGYFIEGLETPILVTGDSLFAGSIGGCQSAELYAHALQRLREVLAPLSGPTILLPGHGPATTLEEELRHNPFLAGQFKS